MPEVSSGAHTALIVGVGARRYALPIASVIETMRPLPLEPLAEGPPFVRGLSLIRGEAVPVVDMQALLEGTTAPAPGRLVLVRAGERRVALAVDRVIGLRSLEEAALAALPPLLAEARGEHVGWVGRLDRQLLMVLEAGRLAPEEAP